MDLAPRGAFVVTFREWRVAHGRPKDRDALSDYVHESGSNEEWMSEFKASTADVGYGVREAVCALANAKGGKYSRG